MSEENNVRPEAMDMLAEPTSWPKVIGIISMVWGGLSVTCAGCGGVMAMVGPAMLPPEMQQGPLPPTMGLNATNITSIGFGFVMAAILFVAGLFTLRRSMTGRTLHLVWSGLSLAWIPVGLYLVFRQDAAMKLFIRENPDSPFSKGPGAESNLGMMIGFGMTILFSIYPLFIFVWFLLIKKTKESFGAEAVKDYI
ncbi:MAG: hypothetical protein K2Y21_12600 [Phycisphaerales bacterium]|nr:hypothetical protein [Phycisphaerales bacterium]